MWHLWSRPDPGEAQGGRRSRGARADDRRDDAPGPGRPRPLRRTRDRARGPRRLSIVDVVAGHQPFANEDETFWGIQNGELYNHEAIRSELQGKGHTFRTRCDTEILPHLFEEAGEQLPTRLRGKFALCVWDARRRRALIARDRLGVKPLYYAVVDDLVVFASELKSVLASGLVSPELDLEAIDAYLTFGYFAAPTTPLLGVRKLPHGHQLIVEDGVRVERYWAFPEPDPDEPRMSEGEAAEALLATLEDAVQLRLMSDVPLGAMLSGRPRLRASSSP